MTLWYSGGAELHLSVLVAISACEWPRGDQATAVEAHLASGNVGQRRHIFYFEVRPHVSQP